MKIEIRKTNYRIPPQFIASRLPTKSDTYFRSFVSRAWKISVSRETIDAITNHIMLFVSKRSWLFSRLILKYTTIKQAMRAACPLLSSLISSPPIDTTQESGRYFTERWKCSEFKIAYFVKFCHTHHLYNIFNQRFCLLSPRTDNETTNGFNFQRRKRSSQSGKTSIAAYAE